MSNKKTEKSCYNCKYIRQDFLTLFPTFWCDNPKSPVSEIPPKRKYCMKFEPYFKEQHEKQK